MKQIKLDIDKYCISNQQVARINKIITLLKLDILFVEVHRSQNKKYHIILHCANKITDYELVCIQALMGSDYKRECFNLLRVKSNKFKKQSWNVLFLKKFQINLMSNLINQSRFP